MAKLKWASVPDRIGWNRLKSLRKIQGLTQTQVAAAAGVSITTIYYLELGYEERATDELKKKIADFFQVDVEDIFPVEMVGNRSKAEFLGKVREGEGRLAEKK